MIFLWPPVVKVLTNKQENLRRLRSLYKWNCVLINEYTEPKAKIIGDFAYITCCKRKRKYTQLYSRGVLKPYCCATSNLKYKRSFYHTQVLKKFSLYVRELLIIWDSYLLSEKSPALTFNIFRLTFSCHFTKILKRIQNS